MNPATSMRNLTPSSTLFGSLTEGFAGVAELFQALHGHDGPAAVVKDHELLEASALPARSLTPVLKVAVYVDAAASGAFGVNTPVCVLPVYVMLPATGVFAESFSANVLAFSVV